MTTAVVTQIAYAVQTLFDPAGTVGRLVDLGKLANYGLLTSFTPAYLFTAGINGTWYDPSDINLTWRRNLLTETEFRNGLVDAPTRGGLISATTLIGYQAAIAFGHDGVTGSYAYKSISVTALTTYNISVVVEMSDGLAPTFGSSSGSDSANDFVFVVAADAVSPITYSVKNFGGTLYRVSATYTVPGAVYGITVGIVKYATNSSRTFKVSAYQLEQGSIATPYQRITDGIQDYLQYQPLPVLYRDAAGTQPVTAVEQPVGLMLDKSKGLVLGPELVTNGDFSNGTTGWSLADGFSVSGGNLVYVAGTGRDASTLISTTAGKWYEIEVRVISASVGVGFYTIQSVQLTGATYTTDTGVRKYSFLATGSTATISIRTAFASGSVTIDNISVRELPGNHAFNPSGNSANFPVLSARYNLLTKTEDFSDAVWYKQPGVTVSGIKYTAPNGTLTADELIFSGASLSVSASTTSTITGLTVAGGMYVKGTAGETIQIAVGGVDQKFTLDGTWQNLTATKTAVGNTANINTYGGATARNVKVWGADLRPANDALNQPAYQRVNTSTDYDTVGFKPYLKFNGTNQWLQTNSIDFSYSDKMFVCAGVRKLSDPADAVALELGPNANATNGTFAIGAPVSSGAQKYDYKIKGTTAVIDVNTTNANFAAPVTSVVSGISSISTDVGILRVNGIQVASSSADQGTGNYGNYPLYIGARAGSLLWANIRLYGAVVAGKQASDAEITATETFINQKTGAY